VKNLLIADIKERTFYVMHECLKVDLDWLDDAVLYQYMGYSPNVVFVQ